MFASIVLRSTPCLSLFLLLLLTSCNQPSSALPEADPVGDPIVEFSDDDPEMQAAMDEARANIDLFIAHLKEFPDDESSIIKAPLDTGGQIEHIWIDHVQFDGEQFTGRLANEPADASVYQQGDEVVISKEEITDWEFIDGDVIQGGYTAQVLEDQRAAE